MGDGKLLVLKDLNVWYSRHKPVLKDFSMELRTNEVVGLIGLNGAGKTTFIKTLSGLLDSFQVETALWQGEVISGRVPFRNRGFKRNRYIVFAEDHSFQFFTFWEYAAYVSSSYGVELSDVDELIRGFGFAGYTDVLLKELSTGNLKKVYLIVGLALKPKLLLLDEPFNGLDFQSTEYLYQRLRSYRQYGTVLFSSHILESICLVSDRVLVLEQGQLRRSFAGTEIQAGEIREVLG